ncbi:MAG: SufD family Fe-S cluster assembly protein [Spirochaetales bacterium]
MHSILEKARKAYELLQWPSSTTEEWRRTPMEKLKGLFQPDSFFQEKTNKIVMQDPGIYTYEESWGTVIHYKEGIWYLAKKEVSTLEIQTDFSQLSLPAQWALEHRIESFSHRIEALSLADPSTLLLLRIPPKVRLQKPVLLYLEEKDKTIFTPHIVILMEKDTEAKIYTRFNLQRSTSRASSPMFFNGGLTYYGLPNSYGTLVIDRVLSPEVVFLLSPRAYLKQDAFLQSLELHLGGPLSKTDLKIELLEKGARAELQGAYLAPPSSFLEMDLSQVHIEGQTQSNTLYKGVVGTGGKTVFQGLIVVKPGASKTDAYLSNRNLLLGSGAHADSIPRLNIGNDDVRCTHGSTTGKIDPLQLFYLRSRGLSLTEARKLLIEGFFSSVLNPLTQEVKEEILERINHSVEQMSV